MDLRTLLHLGITAAFRAGEEILKIYHTDFHVETKPDNTPVTLADKASGHCISGILNASGIPVISEEEEILDHSVRQHWQQVWIVDPLDGTKEFVKRNGEFAVNIALVENKRPVIGIIYSPVLNDLYFACSGMGSHKITQCARFPELSAGPISDERLFRHAEKLPLQALPAEYTIVASRSHLSRDINEHVRRSERLYGPVKMISVGSSIKQCWVAEGKAHEYPRFGTTMEWDTAAGQCILEEAGCQLIDLETGAPMVYNREDMHNAFFIARHSAPPSL